MWSSLIVLAVILVAWLGLRKAGIAPRWVLMIAIPFAVVVLLLSLWNPPEGIRSTEGWLAPGQRSPLDISGTFRTLEGGTFSLQDVQAKVLFVNVWATWCGPCRQEMPSMAALYQEFAGQGLEMVAVTNENAETVRQYLRSNPYPFKILLDPNDTLSQRFGISAIPTTFLVDGEARLIYHHVGYNNWNSDSVRTRIQDILTHE